MLNYPKRLAVVQSPRNSSESEDYCCSFEVTCKVIAHKYNKYSRVPTAIYSSMEPTIQELR